MHILENMLLEDLTSQGETKDVYRVLRLHPNGLSIVWINIWNENAEVEWKDKDELELKLEDGLLSILTEDPYTPLVQRADDDLSETEFTEREFRYSLLESLILANDGMTIYFPRIRSKYIAKIHEETKIARTTLYRYIRRWFQRGQIKNALLPDTYQIGNAGRDKSAGAAKRGRPRKLPVGAVEDNSSGMNITPSVKKIILRAMDEFYVKGGHSFVEAYRKMLEKYFNAGYKFDSGNVPIPIPKPANECPTYDQTYYWYNKERNPEYEKKHRSGKKYFLVDRPIEGDVFMVASAPGHWQIDAIDIPVYLSHPFHPEKIVGKGKAVVITDTFSDYIPGFCLTHGNEAWKYYALAIENAADDKVEFCQKYGITIVREQWDCNYLAYQILADKGPAISYLAGNTSKNLKVELINTPAFRPEQKSKIERRLRPFLEALRKNETPGMIENQGVGDPDYMLDATLTAFELTQIMIYFVLWNNNDWRMKHYPMDREMTAMGIQPYPAQVQEYGIKYLSGSLRVVDKMRVRMAALPTGYAVVDRKGIHFRGFHFRNKIVEQRMWARFEAPKKPQKWVKKSKYQDKDVALVKQKNLRVRDSGRKKIRFQVSFDPRLVDSIYVRLDNGRHIEECVLSPRKEDQRVKGLSWDEAEELRRETRYQEYEHSSNDLQGLFTRDAHMQDIIEGAKQRQNSSSKKQTKKERKSGIRENRAASIRDEDQRNLKDLPVQSPHKVDSQPKITTASDTNSSNQSTGYIPEPKSLDKIRAAKNKKNAQNNEEKD